MLFLSSLLLAAAAIETMALPQAATQPGSSALSGLMSGLMARNQMKQVKKETVAPKYNPEAKRVNLFYGPLDIAGRDEKKPAMEGLSMDPKGQAGIRSIKNVCAAPGCTILSARLAMTDEAGVETTPDKLYIHHFETMTGKKVKTPVGRCSTEASPNKNDISMPFSSFVGRGEDSGSTETFYFAQGRNATGITGFHMNAADTVGMQWDVVNYEIIPKKVLIKLELEYLDGLQGSDAGYSLNSITGCGVGAPKLSNTAPALTTGAKMPVLADTDLVWVRGHLHPGGDNMALLVNGKEACRSEAIYTADGVAIKDMTLCPDTISLKKGDYIQISSLYDLTKHPLRVTPGGEAGHSHGGMVRRDEPVPGAAAAGGHSHGSTGSAMAPMDPSAMGAGSSAMAPAAPEQSLEGADIMGMMSFVYTMPGANAAAAPAAAPMAASPMAAAPMAAAPVAAAAPAIPATAGCTKGMKRA